MLVFILETRNLEHLHSSHLNILTEDGYLFIYLYIYCIFYP
jgi:hypothetical protein